MCIHALYIHALYIHTLYIHTLYIHTLYIHKLYLHTLYTPTLNIHSLHIHTIQGVSRLEYITAGGDFLGLCDQKSSYKHVSDFGRLRSYGHF